MSAGVATQRRVAVVTGSRAEFGLLLPVMRAIERQPSLELRVIVAGAHLLKPAETWRDVPAAGFDIAATIPMQRDGEVGRTAEAAATGRGVEGFARAFEEIRPDWVLVLGDRVEPFAAASAASIAGLAVAHVHGGDRAEGIADESLRHAITKIAHLHLPATEQSARRIERMGERPQFIHVVGSPAVDGLERVEPMTDDVARTLGDPAAVFLMHPSGLDETSERALTAAALTAAGDACTPRAVLCFMPNHDPGREVVAEVVHAEAHKRGWPVADHMPRRKFLSLLKRLSHEPRGLMIGNSSAGLIEAAALRLPAVNVGPRQEGRERPNNVADAPTVNDIPSAIETATRIDRRAVVHPYGPGDAGERIADALASADPACPRMLRKRCAY